MNVPIDRNWFLAENDEEVLLTEFEFGLFRIFNAFSSWRKVAYNCIPDFDLSLSETILLSLIRMKKKPKTLTEITKLINLDNPVNAQYSIRKLLNCGYIKKVAGENKKTNLYAITDKGIKLTENFKTIRKNILCEMFNDAIDKELLKKVMPLIKQMESLYLAAAREASIHGVIS